MQVSNSTTKRNKHAHLSSILIILATLSACASQSDESTVGEVNTSTDQTSVDQPNIDQPGFCDALPAASGTIRTVTPSEATDLGNIVAQTSSNSTILLEDGEYNLNGTMLWFDKPNVTLRSKSGNPQSVVLNGGYVTTQVITIAASDITIAELTIKQPATHAVHVLPASAASSYNASIYRVHIEDPREQAIKVNPKNGFNADSGEVACSRMTLSDAGRTQVNPAITGCYTGGIDAHDAENWVVRDNYIEGFWCANGLSEHAIHFWTGSRGTRIERNVLKDNARGIGLGLLGSGIAREYSDNTCPVADQFYIGHYGGVVVNNFISASAKGLLESVNGFDCGICLGSACQPTLAHNTVVHDTALTTAVTFAGIDLRYAGTYDYKAHNNLLSLPIVKRGGADGVDSHNLATVKAGDFSGFTLGDLHIGPHLTDAVNAGIALGAGIADKDIDGATRDSSPDLGADEL